MRNLNKKIEDYKAVRATKEKLFSRLGETIDVPIIEADITKLQSDTGWKPEIDIEETIKDTLEFYRRYSDK